MMESPKMRRRLVRILKDLIHKDDEDPSEADSDKKDKRARDLPAQGEPNSSDAESIDDDHGQIREHGPDGKAETNYVFGHEHGAGDPRAHDWNWSKIPPRQPGRPLLPGE